MSKSRLFEEKKEDVFHKQHQKLCAELFLAMQKPKYHELSDTLKALLKHNPEEFLKTLSVLQQEKTQLNLSIPDYRKPKNHTTYKIPFTRWSDGLLGEGKAIRKILKILYPKLKNQLRHEKEYKAIMSADTVLKKAKDCKEENIKKLWLDLKAIKLALEEHYNPIYKNEILTTYYYLVILTLTELYFRNTIQGLSHRSISINFTHMLAILVHGDEEIILDALIKNGDTSLFTAVKEEHRHIFRGKSQNHFEDVVDYMEYKKNKGHYFRHDYFEIIPLFIKKCNEHQESLILQEYGIPDKELSSIEKEVIIEKYLHDHHNIKKNIFDNRNLLDYSFLYIEARHINDKGLVLPTFDNYLKQFDQPTKKPSF